MSKTAKIILTVILSVVFLLLLSAMGNSGAIEQDADMVCMIHRPEYYKIHKDSFGNDTKGIAEIIIAKHRNGQVGDVRLRFVSDYARFMNLRDNSIPLPGEEDGTIKSSKINTSVTYDNEAFNSLSIDDDRPF